MSNRIRHYLKEEVERVLPKLHECYRVLGTYQKTRSSIHEKALIAELNLVCGELQIFKEHVQYPKQPYFDLIGDISLGISDRIIALDIAVGAMHIEFPISRSYSHQESEELRRAIGETRRLKSDDDFLPEVTATSVSGIPASGGLFTGKVRVVKRSSEYKRLPKDSVVIARMTRPEFILGVERIGAIVTEQGGSLSHAAVVSRELGIPCVVGAADAMSFFQNGQIVTVNGTDGIVTVVRG